MFEKFTLVDIVVLIQEFFYLFLNFEDSLLVCFCRSIYCAANSDFC